VEANFARPFLLISALLCLAGCTSIAYTFTTLDVPGALAGSSVLQTHALGINDSDIIVGTYLVKAEDPQNIFGIPHGFLREPSTGQYSQRDFAGVDANSAGVFSYKINNRGDMIGTVNGVFSFLFSDGGTDPLVVPPGQPGGATQALGLLVALGPGPIIVGRYGEKNDNRWHGFLGIGGFHTYDPTGDNYERATTPTAVNKHGLVVGFIGPGGAGGPGPRGPILTATTHGFLSKLDGSNLTIIDPPGSTATELWGINDDGLAVGWYDEGNSRSFGFVRRPDGSLAQVLVPFSKNTWIYGVNNLGHIVGMYEDNNVPPGTHGFLGIPQ
jgi:hypothetical protein